MPAQAVITGFGDRDTGGGTFVLGPDGVERIDWLAATGLAVSPDGTRVARLLRGGGDLVISDARGVALYRRIDELSDPHDLLWSERGLVAVATDANRLLHLDHDGALQRVWQADGDGDAWHLNCLVEHDGRVLCTAFGRFRAHRGWDAPGAADGRGILFDVESGEDVVAGLDRPHHPRRVADGWLVCDSGAGGLLHVGDDGRRRQIALSGFVRGLAVRGDEVLVGLSAHRVAGDSGTAQVVVLDPATWTERARHPLPCREIYDIAWVPGPLVDGLRTGFRTNPARAADEDQLALFAGAGIAPVRLWATSDPLPAEACRTELEAGVPPVLTAGRAQRVAWRVRNTGGATLTGSEPHPVRLSWRWWALDGTLVAQGERVPLPGSLPPGEEAAGEAWLVAPDHPGPLEVAVALVQEHVVWFDDVDPANGVRRRVAVQPSSSAGDSSSERTRSRNAEATRP